MTKLADKIINHTIDKFEGGYVNHPADKGGPTNMGITMQAYENYIGRKPTIRQIKDLSRDLACEIYYQDYWVAARIDMLPDGLEHIAFDMCVNHGVNRGVRLLQAGVNECLTMEDRMNVDGRIGPKTVATCEKAIELVGYQKVINQIVDRRLRFYDAIIANNPKQEVFKAGWYKRARWFDDQTHWIDFTVSAKRLPKAKPVDKVNEVTDHEVEEIKRVFVKPLIKGAIKMLIRFGVRRFVPLVAVMLLAVGCSTANEIIREAPDKAAELVVERGNSYCELDQGVRESFRERVRAEAEKNDGKFKSEVITCEGDEE